MGSVKDRNGMDLTEAGGVKKRSYWINPMDKEGASKNPKDKVRTANL